MLSDGVDVSYMQDGREVHDKVWLLDLEDLKNNDWLAVNHFTVIEDRLSATDMHRQAESAGPTS